MAASSQYLTLGLGPETFGIDIRHVREVLDLRPVAALPQAPPFLLGLADVRGEGVPVIDLRTRLGLAPIPATTTTRIIIVEAPLGDRATPVGLVADRVLAVSELDGALDPAPAVGGRWDIGCVAGIGRQGETFVIVLAVDDLLAPDGASPASRRPTPAAA